MNNITKLSLLVFFVAACMSYDLNLIARIPLGELLAFASVPFLLRGIRLNSFADRMKPILWIFTLWILGVVISDFVNGSSLTNFLRGFAKPVWCALWMLFFVGVLIKSPRSLFWYPAGTVVAALQNYFFPQAWTAFRMQSEGYDATAYGTVPVLGAMSVFLAVIVYRKSRLLAAGVLLIYVAVLIGVGAPRSSAALALMTVVCLGYMAWWVRVDRNSIGQVLKARTVIAYGFAAVVVSLLVFELYTFAAGNRWLGEMQYQKYVSQSNSVFGNSLLGLILSGRTAVFGAVLAIIDKPLLGFGSWSGVTLSSYYYDAVSFVGTDARELSQLAGSGRIPGAGHSVFFQLWMESGILAACALVGVLIIIIKQLLKVVQFHYPLAPWLLTAGGGFLWAFLFSPFGVGSRVAIGLFLALSVCMQHYDVSRATVSR